MGYGNRRKRAKRKRARSLNAMKNLTDTQRYWPSSDESSLDCLDQNSNYPSFYSTCSHLSNTGSDGCIVPPSIFLGDTTIRTRQETDDKNNMELDANTEDLFSVVRTDDSDDLSNFSEAFPEMVPPNEDNDDSAESLGSSYFDDNISQVGCHPAEYHSHSFDQVTKNETASYKIMCLLDSAGAPRICYDRLIALLKKLSKTEGFDVQKALNRETLMRRIGRKCKMVPRLQSSTVNKQEVFRFQFQDMLQDLLNSTSQYLQRILPNSNQDDAVKGSEHELWNTPWMRNTFALKQFQDFDPTNDVMLPIILYMDKTGTDVNQRYSLEPVLFSLAAIPREHRERRHSWRHLGFVPQKQNQAEEESTSLLQFYHDCLSYLLEGLKQAQMNPPIVTVQFPNEPAKRLRALMPLMVVMGDQLSQDTLCGCLKSNSGGAGRVHRSCMCSYLNIDDPYHQCKKVNLDTLRLLNTRALITDDEIESKICFHSQTALNLTKEGRMSKAFLQKQRAMFRSILRYPFTTHPITNAFDGVNFGSWGAGICDATCDDFMHSVEGGMVSYITETVYDGLTKKEKETCEELTRPILDNQRCSVISHYPQWRLQPGFTRQTLMTSGERVGSLLALSLSLCDPTIRETIRLGHSRQIQKYLDLSLELLSEKKKKESGEMDSDNPEHPQQSSQSEFYLNQHMHTLDDHCIRHTLEHMIRHGFPTKLIDDLDSFQINQMIWHCSELFKNTQYPENYPTKSIEGQYTDLGRKSIVRQQLFAIVKNALQTKPAKLLKKRRFIKVDGTVAKHLLKKSNKKGEGSSAAVLTQNMGTLVIFLEYVLCYHSFCKYSWSLPIFLQRNYDNIQAGNRFVVEYFQKLLYRGNATVDSRFPKIHSQCRMGDNIVELNTVMNSSCETGERLLKTEAKGVSRTAQKRGKETFLTQTMSRIIDRSIVDAFGTFLESREKPIENPDVVASDQFGRIYPHFIYDVAADTTYAVNRKNEHKPPDVHSGSLESEITKALQKHEPQIQRFEIYNEVVLRDNSRLRASPNYAKSGSWYDYANVSWERETNGVVEEYLLPARCLCFFRRRCQETGVQEIAALIHTVDHMSAGNIPGRPDTLLTRNYRMQYNSKGAPVTHVVPIASIDSAICCFPHIPSKSIFNYQSPGISYLLPRNHWSYVWMAVNDCLSDSNSASKVAKRNGGKLVSLCGSHWLDSVRVRYQTYLNATSAEDI